MLGLIVLNIYPMIDTVRQSFYKTGDFGKGNVCGDNSTFNLKIGYHGKIF